jgi:Transposase DDE domain
VQSRRRLDCEQAGICVTLPKPMTSGAKLEGRFGKQDINRCPAAQRRLDQDPQAMRRRRETMEHSFGTLKMRMGATHFLMKRSPKVASEMALSVLAYNLTRVMNIIGTRALLAAIRV